VQVWSGPFDATLLTGTITTITIIITIITIITVTLEPEGKPITVITVITIISDLYSNMPQADGVRGAPPPSPS
jgi:hypothetical protein